MKLFVYGSLLDPYIRKAVIGREVEGVSTSINDYIVGEHSMLPYPTLVAFSGGNVHGRVLDITNEELKKVDRYETTNYNRIKVKLDNGELVYTYIDST